MKIVLENVEKRSIKIPFENEYRLICKKFDLDQKSNTNVTGYLFKRH